MSVKVLDWISDESKCFLGDEQEFHETMAILYFAMVAEENKQPEWRWPMKKRVKKLGVWELLMCGLTPEDAASASIGQKAKANLARLARYEAEEEVLLANEDEVQGANAFYQQYFEPFLDD